MMAFRDTETTKVVDVPCRESWLNIIQQVPQVGKSLESWTMECLET